MKRQERARVKAARRAARRAEVRVTKGPPIDNTFALEPAATGGDAGEAVPAPAADPAERE
jgi:hypothetical protein